MRAVACAALASALSLGCGEDVMRLGSAQQPASEGAVDSILLREAVSGILLSDLADRVALSVAALPSPLVSLEAVVSGDVRSVEFVVDGRSDVEVVVPFTFPGDIEGKLDGFQAVVGAHVVTATPYSLEEAKGQRGAPLTFPFSFVE